MLEVEEVVEWKSTGSRAVGENGERPGSMVERTREIRGRRWT
jgi:hypothetical protein